VADLADPHMASDPATGLSIAVPEGWAQLPQEPDDEGFAPLVLAPAQWPDDFGFRPNVTVVAGMPVSPVPSVRLAGTRAMAAALATEDTRVIAYDVWPLPVGEGRRLVFAYFTGTTSVVATQLVLVHDDRTVVVTASVDTDRYARLLPVVDACLASVTFDPASRAPEESTEAKDPTEPRPDEFWAARGEQLEDLTAVAPAQPFPDEGLETTRAGLGILLEAGRGRVRTDRLDDAGRAAADELVAGELLDRDGKLTEAGRGFVDVIASPQRHVRVEAAAGLAPLTFDAYWRGDRAVVVATEAPRRWAGRSASGEDVAAMAHRVRLHVLPTSWLPVLLAAWLDVGPAWLAEPTPTVLPTALVTARVDDPSTPQPADADDILSAMWAQPWFMWTLQTSNEQAVAGIDVGRFGQLSLTQEEGDTDEARLTPWPAQSLFATITALVLG